MQRLHACRMNRSAWCPPSHPPSRRCADSTTSSHDPKSSAALICAAISSDQTPACRSHSPGKPVATGGNASAKALFVARPVSAKSERSRKDEPAASGNPVFHSEFRTDRTLGTRNRRGARNFDLLADLAIVQIPGDVSEHVGREKYVQRSEPPSRLPEKFGTPRGSVPCWSGVSDSDCVREAYIVELDLVESVSSRLHGYVDIVVPDFFLSGIGPGQAFTNRAISGLLVS